MGDKNPKSKQKSQKQDAVNKQHKKDAHDAKQAPAPAKR
jgi:hypothetical protein